MLQEAGVKFFVVQIDYIFDKWNIKVVMMCVILNKWIRRNILHRNV